MINEQTFLEQMIDILDCEPEECTMHTALEDHEDWDSLAKLSFLAMADAEFSLNLSDLSLDQYKTVDELYNLLKERL